MVTLQEFNQQRRDEIVAQETVKRNLKNNIACPTCGEEMIDDKPDHLYTSMPPQKSVACLACGYRGFRVA